MEGAWRSWERRDSSKGSILITHWSASMTFTNPHATWVHFQNLMELYWPKESLQVTGTTLPAPRTTLCLHTSAGSARGILDSAENSLPLASYFIKKLARDQKKKKKKDHVRIQDSTFLISTAPQEPTRTWNSPFACSSLEILHFFVLLFSTSKWSWKEELS